MSAPVRVLAVDDRRENLLALQAILEGLSVEVVSVTSGEEALKKLLVEDYAVILLDAQMPGMDGFETASNIKRLDQTKDVPIILLTGEDTDSDYAYRGYALGAADFVTKPFDPWLLRTKVNVFLELHHKNRRLTERVAELERTVQSLRAAPGE
jgi:CheY-like chemotaxis protein